MFLMFILCDLIVKMWKSIEISGLLWYISINYWARMPGINVNKMSKVSKEGAKPGSNWSYKGGNWTGQVLKQGDYGPQVLQLQQMLARKHFYPEKGAKNNGVDSYYGAKTADATGRCQSIHGVKVDKIAGKATYNKLKLKYSPCP